MYDNGGKLLRITMNKSAAGATNDGLPPQKTYPHKIQHLKPLTTASFSPFFRKFCGYDYLQKSKTHINLHPIQENFLFAL